MELWKFIFLPAKPIENVQIFDLWNCTNCTKRIWLLMTNLCLIPRVADPDLFGRIRIRKIFTGSWSISYWYFGYVQLYKQGKNIWKITLLHIFRWIFTFFQIKLIIIQISEEIWLMWENKNFYVWIDSW